MRRREFITLLGGTAVAPVLRSRAARSQQAAMPVVGLLSSASAWETMPQIEAFHRGLSETGFVENRDVLIEARFAESHYDRLPALATELARRPVSVIAALGTPAAPAAKAATSTIPIVFRIGLDPVEMGLVASLNRPGGNMTGVVSLNIDLEPKRVALLQEVVPAAKVIAGLVNPTNLTADTITANLQAAARTLGLQMLIAHAGSDADFDGAFAAMREQGADGLVVTSDPYFTMRAEPLAARALRHRIPAISIREFPAAGGLMGYGGSNAAVYRLCGTYVGRILKGEKPAELPVAQATLVDLVINMKTAKTLGLAVPITLLGRADEVIE